LVHAQGRIRELDGWRGVSILLVLAHHAVVYAFPASVGRYKLWSHVFEVAGTLGVCIFFAISGFVITRLLLIEERDYGSISLRGFYTRRVFRILPVFYLFILLVCCMSRFGWTPVAPKSVLLAALFLRSQRFHGIDWFLGHSWSLSVEEQFYIVFPLFWVISAPQRRARLLLATFAIFLIWSALVPWGIFAKTFSGSTVIGFGCVNAGALLAVCEEQARGVAGKVPHWAALLVAVFLFARPVPYSRLTESLYVLFIPFAVALLLMHTASQKGWASSALKTGGIQWVGLISYSAYLWQQLFTAPAGFYGSPKAANIFHLSLPLLVPVAAISYYCIERPCTRLGRRLSANLQPIRAEKVLVWVPSCQQKLENAGLVAPQLTEMQAVTGDKNVPI
jgi:peptidoglycan/LPS O-acetylase OafA/YrhL